MPASTIGGGVERSDVGVVGRSARSMRPVWPISVGSSIGGTRSATERSVSWTWGAGDVGWASWPTRSPISARLGEVVGELDWEAMLSCFWFCFVLFCLFVVNS